jgi:hypothetical protein
VGIAALKFADLQNFRGTSYVFDLDRFTSFEGKTGPYLLYQSVRIKSILRKAAEQKVVSGPIVVGEPAERDLTLLLDAFEGALSRPTTRRPPTSSPSTPTSWPRPSRSSTPPARSSAPTSRRPGLAPGPGRDDAEAAGAGPEPAGHRSAGADVGSARGAQDP